MTTLSTVLITGASSGIGYSSPLRVQPACAKSLRGGKYRSITWLRPGASRWLVWITCAGITTMAGAANRCVIPEHKFEIERLALKGKLQHSEVILDAIDSVTLVAWLDRDTLSQAARTECSVEGCQRLR